MFKGGTRRTLTTVVGTLVTQHGNTPLGRMPPGYVSTVRGRARFQMPNRRFVFLFEESFEKELSIEPGTGANARSITEIKDLIDLCLKLQIHSATAESGYDRLTTALWPSRPRRYASWLAQQVSS